MRAIESTTNPASVSLDRVVVVESERRKVVGESVRFSRS